MGETQYGRGHLREKKIDNTVMIYIHIYVLHVNNIYDTNEYKYIYLYTIYYTYIFYILIYYKYIYLLKLIFLFYQVYVYYITSLNRMIFKARLTEISAFC